MDLKMVFYLINEAIVVNMPEPSARIGGGLHALNHIFGVVHIPGLAYEIGASMYNRLGSGKMSPAPVSLLESHRNFI
jgi:hypothetical protein